jgi:hypothetical protein
MTGLYGAKRMRNDTRFVGRTIVHSLADGPTVRPVPTRVREWVAAHIVYPWRR